MANYNKNFYTPKIKISYKIADGYNFQPKNKFTHIMVGGGLSFFSNPETMFNRCIEMLRDGGYVLATIQAYCGITSLGKSHHGIGALAYHETITLL